MDGSSDLNSNNVDLKKIHDLLLESDYCNILSQGVVKTIHKSDPIRKNIE